MLLPHNATIRPGETLILSATLLDGGGRPITGAAIRWTSGNEAVATVSSTGQVVGLAVGHALIIANAEGMTQVSLVTVFVPPQRGKNVQPSMDPAKL